MPGRGRRWRHRGWSRRAIRLLEPVLLLLLHHGPAHGYTLLDRLDEFGLADLNPSVVYRALREMEAREWLTSSWDEEETQGPPRRVYDLTALGDEVLASWVQDMTRTRELIDHIMTVYERHMETDPVHEGAARGHAEV
jgi:DNA-binding PadR family transcriptional regulator